MNKLALPIIFALVALLLLIPGITQPVLSISGTIDKSKLADASITMLADGADAGTRNMLRMASGMLGLDRLEGEVEAYQKTRSIWGTIKELSEKGNQLVAILVATFSILIPVTKLLMQIMTALIQTPKIKTRLNTAIQHIAKWSMADVFIIALIVTYLAGSAKGQLGDLIVMEAQLELGFYYFLGYCIFSVASGYLFRNTRN